MILKILASTILTMLFSSTEIPLHLVAQDNAGSVSMHHHYKLIDLGTFGGPQNYINGDFFLVDYMGPAQNVNNAGTLIGSADTSTPDPFQPDFCFNHDCFVSHAFKWHDGFKTDLGVLHGGVNSATAWISANGLIAGASQNGEFDPLDPGFPENRAVLWRDGHIIDLGTLPEGGYESGAQAVNSRGQVVGWAFNTIPNPNSMGVLSSLFNFYEPVYPFQERAFLWENGVMQDLGTLGTGTDSYAMAINERGQVIGISYTSSTPNQVVTMCSLAFFGATTGPTPTQDPFLWENGKLIDLGSLGGTCGLPLWINDSGAVVGWSDLAGDQVFHAFLWTRTRGMQDLGTLGGNLAMAQMINDSGDVVGNSTLPGDSETHAFIWNGKMHDLGALNGCSSAFAINAHAQVVGNWGGPNCLQGGFLWERGGPMVDLNTLVSNVTGLSVAGAIEINALGEIAGGAKDVDGNVHAILLVPCDDNHPGVEECDYSLVDGSTAAQITTHTDGAVSGATNKNNVGILGWWERLHGPMMPGRGFSHPALSE